MHALKDRGNTITVFALQFTDIGLQIEPRHRVAALQPATMWVWGLERSSDAGGEQGGAYILDLGHSSIA